MIRFTVFSGAGSEPSQLPDLVNVLVVLAYFAVMVAMFVIALLFIIQLSVGAMFLLLVAQLLTVANLTVMLR